MKLHAHCLNCNYPHLVDAITLLCDGCKERQKRGGATNRGLAQPEPEEESREAWFARREREGRRGE